MNVKSTLGSQHPKGVCVTPFHHWAQNRHPARLLQNRVARLHFPEFSQGRTMASTQAEVSFHLMSPWYVKQWGHSQKTVLSLTGGAGRQAAILRGAAATARVVLVLGAGHHEVWQGAWDILGKVLGELSLGGQGVLWKTMSDGPRAYQERLLHTGMTSYLSKNTLS